MFATLTLALAFQLGHDPAAAEQRPVHVVTYAKIAAHAMARLDLPQLGGPYTKWMLLELAATRRGLQFVVLDGDARPIGNARRIGPQERGTVVIDYAPKLQRPTSVLVFNAGSADLVVAMDAFLYPAELGGAILTGPSTICTYSNVARTSRLAQGLGVDQR